MENLGRFGLAGMPVVVSPLATERAVVRQPGGYEYRWLIRAEVERPCAYVAGDMLIVHPSIVDQLPRRAREDTVGMYRTIAAL